MFRYADQFATRKRVAIGFDFTERFPATSDELQLLETFHLILDMYVWLGQRFPNEFFEAKVASDLQGKASDLITRGLDILTEKSTKSVRPRSGKKGKVKFDRDSEDY